MAYNLKLDEYDDIIIGRGATRIGGASYVAQLVKCRLTVLLGEWELDPSVGIDWYNMMGANANLSIIQGIVSTTIRETRGVDSLTTIELIPDIGNRKLSITFTGIASGETFTETVTT